MILESIRYTSVKDFEVKFFDDFEYLLDKYDESIIHNVRELKTGAVLLEVLTDEKYNSKAE